MEGIRYLQMYSWLFDSREEEAEQEERIIIVTF